MITKHFLRAFAWLLLLVGTAHARKEKPVFRKTPPIKTIQSIKDGPATVFIHGTIVPLISRFTHGVEYPHGLISFMDCPDPNRLTRIAQTLSGASPEEFFLESFYFYCWPGDLKFSERKKATEKLYATLCKHTGPLTLLAHSHGCNVALYLAELAAADKSSSLSIDRLIMFACPVQLATAHLVKSPLFKSVFSFYSTADLGQIIDPQGLYDETKKVSKDSKSPLFSKRKFDDDAPNLIQARVLMNRQSPGHLSFLTPRFLSRLPSILSLLEESVAHKGERHFIVNIPRAPEAPHLIEKIEIAHRYVPRTTRSPRVTHDKQYKSPLTA